MGSYGDAGGGTKVGSEGAGSNSTNSSAKLTSKERERPKAVSG